jgi:hypothetical protein
VTAAAKSAVRCCKDVGNNVEGESNLGPSGAKICNNEKTFEEAKDLCENTEINSSTGWRLCTRTEIKAGEAAGTGCGYDNKQVWTSDSC